MYLKTSLLSRESKNQESGIVRTREVILNVAEPELNIIYKQALTIS